jgi:hypothetical protein
VAFFGRLQNSFDDILVAVNDKFKANTNKNKVTRVLGGRDESGSGYVWLNSSLWIFNRSIDHKYY